ncbi:PD-(D/E)XK motif protein [Cohnella panacarvi]|uniref:PD-(D/E)XK motif protein n=1 Tax=Cohnella panacarvi TaxID=400776 RepID=UPI000478D320|nr:PD-(D/E)XK motif protein [Cohnella panacarvi]
MTITPESLQRQWDSIKYRDGGFLQVDIKHPLEWHIGFQSISQKTLLLVSDIEIGDVISSKSMAVSRRRRESDNWWTLSFELLRDEQESVFAILCSDIVAHSQSASNKKEALTLVISRYKQWSRLLESQKSGLMDEHSRKGLIGELIFLSDRLDASDSALTTVQGWIGADGADQDFAYADSWFEVKSVGASATSVTISSLEQLDCNDYGELVIMRIDKTAPEKNGAFSLNDIVKQICDQLSGNSDVLDIFRSKLAAYGYIDLQAYSEQKYYYSGTQCYSVNVTFPRITKKTVPAQIVSLHYELNLPSLQEWQKG